MTKKFLIAVLHVGSGYLLVADKLQNMATATLWRYIQRFSTFRLFSTNFIEKSDLQFSQRINKLSSYANYIFLFSQVPTITLIYFIFKNNYSSL